MKNEGRLLALIIAAGVLLRAVLGAVHPYAFDDTRDYVSLAMRLLGDGSYIVQTKTGWVTANRMPGYPLFLAGLFAIFGESLRAVAITQGILSAGIIGLTYAIARRAGPIVGLLAALLIAVDPLTLGFSAAILSEMPFTLFLLAALWACIRLGAHGRIAWWIALGCLWGAAVYLRASAIWLLPLLLLWTLVVPLRPRRLAGALTALLLAGATLLPWFLRNGQGIRLTSMEGISLYESVYPAADGGPKQDTLTLSPDMLPLNEWQRDAEWKRRAWSAVEASPGHVLALVPVKIARTWSPWMNAAEMRNAWLQAGMIAWQVPLFFFALLGIFAGRLPGRMKALILLPMLYFTALHSIFLGSVRYRVPLMPLVCVFAALGAVALVRRMTGKRDGAERV